MTQATEFENAFKQWRDLTIDSWSRVGQQLVETDSVAQTMGASFDWYLEIHRRMRENTRTFLQTLDVPTGEDLARLSRQVVAAEGRVLDGEERVDLVEARLDEVRKQVAAVADNVSAVADQLEDLAVMRARIEELEQRLAASTQSSTPARKTTQRRTRK